jgi:hypothetical protein
MSNVETWSQLVMSSNTEEWGALTLRNHGETALGVLLDALVHERVAARENIKENLRHGRSLVASSVTCIDNTSWDVFIALLNVNSWVAVLNLATMANISLNENVDKVANNRFGASILDNDEGP